MSQLYEKQLLEFIVYLKEGENCQLYIENGKPILIKCCSPYEYKCTTTYPEDNMFGLLFEIIVTKLSQYENLKNLKNLYNALEQGHWKEVVNRAINNCIDYFEKGIEILKS